MFSPKTFDFLIENRLANSKEWFHEHKNIYDEYVLKPLTELASALGPAIEAMDGKIVTVPKINKVISRIYRDTRFSNDKSLYRESMWLSFKRDKKAFPHYPEFFVAFSPQIFSYGCGYYWAKPETMKCMRKLIENGAPEFKKALKAYENQSVFKIDGESYKRTKYPDYPDNIREWLDNKNICFIHYSDDFSLVFSDSLADTLKDDLRLMKPVYDFLILAETKAEGILV